MTTPSSPIPKIGARIRPARGACPAAYLPAIMMAAVLSVVSAAAVAKPWWMRGTESNDTDFLDPNVAFRVAAHVDGNLIRVRWVLADGYYLYRSKMEFKAESPDLVVSAAQLPPGMIKTDPYLGTQEIYTQQVEAQVPYTRLDGGAHPLQIKVIYQGCAEAGLCYPPITKVLFPVSSTAAGSSPASTNPPHRWEIYAIVGGGFAFLFAGGVLRKRRRLAPV